MRVWPGLLVLCILFAASLAAQPIISRINVGSPDLNNQSVVTGVAGAVEANADVILVTVETGHYTTTRAGSDGSFSATLFAPRGTSIMVKSDPAHTHVKRIVESPTPRIDHLLSEVLGLRGTIVTVPIPAFTTGAPFAGAGVFGVYNSAPWTVEGTLSKQIVSPGETIETSGTLTVLIANSSGNNPRAQFGLTLELMSDANGAPATAYAMFDSAVMTPTGLPIERFPVFSTPFGQFRPLAHQGTSWSTTFSTSFTVPADFRPGYYLARLGFTTPGLPTPPVDPTERRTTFISQFRNLEGQLQLPVIRVGASSAPRLPAVLLLNDLSEGDRGAVAKEDRGRYAPTNHIATSSDVLVIARADPRTGAPRRYNLEPFTTTIGVSDRGGPPNAPLVPFQFPSGSLTVNVRAPNGTTRTLGPSPFRQWDLFGPVGPDGQLMEGGPHITDAFQLKTLDPAFDVTFAEDGLHVVTVDGQIDDRWANRWRVGGTYEIHVGRTLLIDSAVIPTTPFEVSDSVVPVVNVIPAVPAEVEMRIRHSKTDKRILGRANRFGVFAAADGYRFDEPGEYRIDVVARYRGADGSVWTGSRTWGSVVAPRESPIIAHGRRGIDAQQSEKQQWFFRSQTGDPMGRDHVNFPFHAGDVAWLQEGDSSIPIVTFQDPQGSLVNTFTRLRPPQFSPLSPDRIAKGELPLFSGNLSGRDPHLAPERADVWAYSYRGVQRPLVRVREQIGEDPAEAYWRFNDRYGLQSGNGMNGDLPNDFKFQFGGVVLRGALFNPPLYAIYGSLFVLVPADDSRGGTRVFPPFQGNGGGPSGGPLFTLKGRDIDLFFHPTAIRPGSILQVAETASFAGYSAPTLPSKIEIVVTSPSGVRRTIRGQANKIGYFYDPSQDFAVFETGVWKAKVKITFDGLTSAGQVTAPFPTGDVLGSREGEFYFYVVDGQSTPLEVAPMPQFVRPLDGPLTFRAIPPPGLNNLQLTYTATTPGFILEEGTTASLTYTYDLQRLARDFPNLDLIAADRPGGVDLITMSFLLNGTDSSGVRRHFARQIVLNGEEVLMPDHKPGPPRRRSVRR